MLTIEYAEPRVVKNATKSMRLTWVEISKEDFNVRKRPAAHGLDRRSRSNGPLGRYRPITALTWAVGTIRTVGTAAARAQQLTR